MSGSKPATMAVPVVEEALVVRKQDVETGRLRVSLSTETVEDVVRETLRGRRAVVDRVPVGREVHEPPQVREEDGVLVIPVVEEILVVEKRLLLKEELRVRYLETEEMMEVPVERRVQTATVERTSQEEG
jgi:stress response protein YsnF